MNPVKKTAKKFIADAFYAVKKIRRDRPSVSQPCRILMYHTVENIDPASDKLGLAVSTHAFRQQMSLIMEKGFSVVSLGYAVGCISSGKALPPYPVVISFDDGYKGVRTNAFPILAEFSFAATVFISVDIIERRTAENGYWSAWEPMSWDDISYLAGQGIEMGSHGLSHCRLTDVSIGRLEAEIMESKKIIGSKAGKAVGSFSYPHGAFNDVIKEQVKYGEYACACSSIEGANPAGSDRFELRRTEITGGDDIKDFEKKLAGCYDWVGKIKKRA
jgi:peptidoglycan/xylan/chitin deacetylase (PgdA/CDA1 family)